MSKTALQQQIKAAFVSLQGSTATNPEDAYNRISTDITNAVDTYVKEEFEKLKTALMIPGAFTGTGTGTVVVSPGTIAAYEPGIP